MEVVAVAVVEEEEEAEATVSRLWERWWWPFLVGGAVCDEVGSMEDTRGGGLREGGIARPELSTVLLLVGLGEGVPPGNSNRGW